MVPGRIVSQKAQKNLTDILELKSFLLRVKYYCYMSKNARNGIKVKWKCLNIM